MRFEVGNRTGWFRYSWGWLWISVASTNQTCLKHLKGKSASDPICFCLLSSLTNQPLECSPPPPNLDVGQRPIISAHLAVQLLGCGSQGLAGDKDDPSPEDEHMGRQYNFFQYDPICSSNTKPSFWGCIYYLREDGGRDQLSNEGFTLSDAPFPSPSSAGGNGTPNCSSKQPLVQSSRISKESYRWDKDRQFVYMQHISYAGRRCKILVTAIRPPSTK